MASPVLFSLTVIKVICIYIKSKCTCEEEAVLCQSISTVAENMDLLKVLLSAGIGTIEGDEQCDVMHNIVLGSRQCWRGIYY